jgi:cysteinyl-tRNA synthetase
MLEMIEALVAKGDAYVTEGGNVYFAVERFPAYGRLSKNSIDDLVAGARVAVLDEKRHPADFALWKRDENHQMQWDSPWGRGFPGWHAECSVMARKYLGDTIDIHTGGEDNVFPHHECEIAQSESFTGKKFVRYWLHNRHLLVDGGKMSKSEGTMYTVQDVEERGGSLRALRYLLLSVHYRLPINFTWEAFAGADATVKSLDAFVRTLSSDEGVADRPEVAALCEKTDADFLAALCDDLNISPALAAVHDFRHAVNKAGTLSSGDLDRVKATLGRVDSVLGLDLLAQGASGADDAEIDALVAERQAARAAKDWARADEIRDELAARGIVVEDTADGGVRWYRG